MELSENERMMLVAKKEEIKRITDEIFDIHQDKNKKNQVLKKITQILNCLSIIAGYATNKERFHILVDYAKMIDSLYDIDQAELLIESEIRSFSYYANSIVFENTKKGLKITIPNIEIPKIEFSIFKTEI